MCAGQEVEGVYVIALLILPPPKELSIQCSVAHLQVLHILAGATTHTLMVELSEPSERVRGRSSK